MTLLEDLYEEWTELVEAVEAESDWGTKDDLARRAEQLEELIDAELDRMERDGE